MGNKTILEHLVVPESMKVQRGEREGREGGREAGKKEGKKERREEVRSLRGGD